MPSFTKKSIPVTDRVCFRLKQARESAGITLETIALKTKINKDYLAALENCDFDALQCAPLYQKNFIKKYAAAIGLDPQTFISQFNVEELNSYQRPHLSSPNSTYKRTHLSNLPNLIRYGTLTLIACALLFYLGREVKHTLEPPSLTLSSPLNGFIAQNNSIPISGATEPEVKIAINGEHIRSDEHGRFNELVTLNPGINTIVVTAQKKHGKTTEETRHIIFKETPKFTLSAEPKLQP